MGTLRKSWFLSLSLLQSPLNSKVRERCAMAFAALGFGLDMGGSGGELFLAVPLLSCLTVLTAFVSEAEIRISGYLFAECH